MLCAMLRPEDNNFDPQRLDNASDTLNYCYVVATSFGLPVSTTVAPTIRSARYDPVTHRGSCGDPAERKYTVYVRR